MSTRELSQQWMAPTSLSVGDVGHPVRCLATTYTFDAAYFERELLPRFLGLRYDDKESEELYLLERDNQLGTVPVSVLVDARMVSSEQSTVRWDQLPIFVPQGIQHAKVSVLVWERAVRVMIGSANLTAAAYRTNREMMATLDFFDGVDSPPRSLLFEVLEFLSRVSVLSRGADELKQRVKLQIVETRRLVDSWSSIREEFTPQERPRVHFVSGFPAYGGQVATRVLDTTLSHWGSRVVSDMILITPFVDESEARQRALWERLSTLVGIRKAGVLVLLPAERVESAAPLYEIQAPRSFAKAVATVFPDYEWLEVVLAVQGGDSAARALHAKMLLLQSDARTMLLMGSSNFTSRGMGAHLPNVEANLCYIDDATARDNLPWADRLPVSGSACGIEKDATVTWLEKAPVGDGADSSIGLLPAFFDSATIRSIPRQDDKPIGGILSIVFDLSQSEPRSWRIATLSRGGLEKCEIVSGDRKVGTERVEWSLPSHLHPRSLRVLEVSWRDEHDESDCVALLPVGLKSSSDLPLSVDFPPLSADEIMATLIAGRDAAGYVAQRVKQAPAPSSSATVLDPLRTVKTEGYMLYRTRRLGRAIARAGDRLADTPSTPSAMRYRLMVDPLGIVSLARAIERQQREDERLRSVASTVQGSVFALAELILMLGHAGKSAQERARESGLSVLPTFREAAHMVHEVAVAAANPHGPGEQIHDYLARCLEQTAKLLRGYHAIVTGDVDAA